MPQKKAAAPELIEIKVSRSWIKLMMACQEKKGKCEVRFTLINHQPADFSFGEEVFRADLDNEIYPTIEGVATAVTAKRVKKST